MLLASGAISLYQLALIEAGNLDALVLGRLRVIDRLRATPKEAIYRVHDPKRVGEKSGGDGEREDERHAEEHELHRQEHGQVGVHEGGERAEERHGIQRRAPF